MKLILVKVGYLLLFGLLAIILNMFVALMLVGLMMMVTDDATIGIALMPMLLAIMLGGIWYASEKVLKPVMDSLEKPK